MILGHSYLPNDTDFGQIEPSSKTMQIYVPEDWENVVRQARCKNPFTVSRMEREDFVSLDPLKAAIVNRKVNTHYAKVEWLKIHWIAVSKEQPLQFCYRHSNNSLECWKTVDLKRPFSRYGENSVASSLLKAEDYKRKESVRPDGTS